MTFDKLTSELISELKDNEIFVFGSNTKGLHAGGAAYYASKLFGAEWGVSEGPTGRTYAIPTCTPSIEKVSVNELKNSIDRFIQYAKENPTLNFLVTPIGCGIAGWNVADVAPMFEAAKSLPNVSLPESFWKYFLETKTNNQK